MPVRRLVGVPRGELDRPGLQARLDPIARELQRCFGARLLLRGFQGGDLLRNLLALYPALWLFASIEGVEPTNNHVERILRLGVLWRRIPLVATARRGVGSWSGC